MCISGGSVRQSFRSTVEGSTSGVLLFLLRSRGFSLIWLQAGCSTVYEDCACYVFLFVSRCSELGQGSDVCSLGLTSVPDLGYEAVIEMVARADKWWRHTCFFFREQMRCSDASFTGMRLLFIGQVRWCDRCGGGIQLHLYPDLRFQPGRDVCSDCICLSRHETSMLCVLICGSQRRVCDEAIGPEWFEGWPILCNLAAT
ncbi:hypothetical protein DY000_02014685 [Brassica cretica]|uniref:Uncharacterized protein n=1 Tax=Brassica cretica TaxID=69181 RepID=A0ABQ7CUJ4_BRACR|nr:hypothetical protein DY000_02014685 [Brassica cretica]